MKTVTTAALIPPPIKESEVNVAVAMLVSANSRDYQSRFGRITAATSSAMAR